MFPSRPRPSPQLRGRGIRVQEKTAMNRQLEKEAQDCRERALSYLGSPEGAFLPRVAREFDRLAAAGANQATLDRSLASSDVTDTG